MAHQRQSVDISQVLQYLNTAFAKTAQRASKTIGRNATRDRDGITTPMYDYQVEFCYLVDDIQRSPAYIVPKLIQQANELIDKLEGEIAE